MGLKKLEYEDGETHNTSPNKGERNSNETGRKQKEGYLKKGKAKGEQ